MKQTDAIKRVQVAIDSLSKGGLIVLVDDKDREDEGDLVCLGSLVSTETISFMMNKGKGLICASISERKRLDMGLPLQVENNEATFGTNFGVPFSYFDVADSGISASSRAKTINELSKPHIRQEDFVRPGCVIPVVGREGGVLSRRGQTEGSLDLAKFAGAPDVAVICEILAEDGSVLRANDLVTFSELYQLPMCSVEDVVQYRELFDISVRAVLTKQLSSSVDLCMLREILESRGQEMEFDLEGKNLNAKFVVFMDDVDKAEHFALVVGDLKDDMPVRIHSECLTGDIFGSLRCDCGAQLDASLEMFIRNGSGVLVYLRQEGRGIGLLNKLKAYELQEQGYDTVQANEILGFRDDERDYKIAGSIIKSLGLSSIKLLTNNPLKVQEISKVLKISERLAIQVPATEDNLQYLRTKKDKLGHILSNLDS